MTTARRDLVTALIAAGIPASEVIPAKINTPTHIGLAPHADYITWGDSFGRDLEVTMSAFVLVKPKNDVADLAALDSLLTTLAAVAPGLGWGVRDIEEPDLLMFGDWAMYGVRATIHTTIEGV